MKILYRFLISFQILSFPFFFTGCNFQMATATPIPVQPTPDINATVEAAISETEAAQLMMQATIDQAVLETAAAIPTSVIIITLPPTPSPEDVYALSEEELAAVIDQSVNEAIAAYDIATTTTEQAYSDDVLTYDEVEAAYNAYEIADEEIDAALALAEEYLAIYNDLGEETITLLIAIEEDLSAMTEAATAATETLTKIFTDLQAGLEATQETIDQLQQQVQQAGTNAQELQDQIGNWEPTVRDEIDRFDKQFTGVQPNQVSGDRLGAIQLSKDYLTTVRNSLTDNKISFDELNNIAQLGANASFSLKQFPAPEMSSLGTKIDGMTRQLSRGEIPQVRGGLSDLERSIPRR